MGFYIVVIVCLWALPAALVYAALSSRLKHTLRYAELLHEKIKGLERRAAVREGLGKESLDRALKRLANEEANKPTGASEPTMAPAPAAVQDRPANSVDNPQEAPRSAAATSPMPARRSDDPSPSTAREPHPVMAVLQQNPFATVGALLLLAGVVVLLTLLAKRDFFSPALRVLSVAGGGVALLAGGTWLARKRPDVGGNLQGAGLGVLFLTALWAHGGYGLISAPVSFFLMSSLAALGTGWAALTCRPLLALMCLAGTLLTPALVDASIPAFAGLALYGLAVSGLGIGAAAYLRAPYLAAATLAGLGLLLGTAGLPDATSASSIVALVATLVLFLGATLSWTGPIQAWRKSEEGTIAAIALGAPLLLTGLLYGRAELSQGLCALMLGIIAVIYLLVARRACGGLPTLVTAVGCALAVVAIGVGLDGTSRMLALSASTLGVITLAHGVRIRLATYVAAAYWCAIAALGAATALLDANALHPIAETMPLVLAGAIALYAARVHVGTPLGQAYAVLAPVAVGVGVLHTNLTASSATAFMLAWSLAAALVAHKWRWPQLRLGALATIPAGLWLFLSDPPGVFDLSAWVQREALILAWLGVSATLVRHLGSKPVSASEREADQLFLLAVPILMTAELARAMGVFDVPMDRLPLLASMVWGLWIAGHGWLGRYRPAPAVAIGLTLGLFVLSTLLTPYGLAAGAASVLVPVLTWMTLKYDARRRVSQLAAAAVLVALLGAALRYAGGLEGIEANVASLLFEREVQHWVTALWAAVAVGLIAYASRRRRRGLWGLWGLGTLVTFLLLVKMLLVDIAALGAVAQVGTFMGVGVAFLVLGYFCPRPPAVSDAAPAAGLQEGSRDKAGAV